MSDKAEDGGLIIYSDLDDVTVVAHEAAWGSCLVMSTTLPLTAGEVREAWAEHTCPTRPEAEASLAEALADLAEVERIDWKYGGLFGLREQISQWRYLLGEPTRPEETL